MWCDGCSMMESILDVVTLTCCLLLLQTGSEVTQSRHGFGFGLSLSLAKVALVRLMHLSNLVHQLDPFYVLLSRILQSNTSSLLLFDAEIAISNRLCCMLCCCRSVVFVRHCLIVCGGIHLCLHGNLSFAEFLIWISHLALADLKKHFLLRWFRQVLASNS